MKWSYWELYASMRISYRRWEMLRDIVKFHCFCILSQEPSPSFYLHWSLCLYSPFSRPISETVQPRGYRNFWELWKVPLLFSVVFKVMGWILSLEDTENKASLSHFSFEMFEDITESSLLFFFCIRDIFRPLIRLLDAGCYILIYNTNVDYLTLQGTCTIIIS